VRAHSVILITPVLPCKGAEGPAAFQTGDFAPRGDPAPGMDPRLTKWLGTGGRFVPEPVIAVCPGGARI
jgi:hypothetical protein